MGYWKSTGSTETEVYFWAGGTIDLGFGGPLPDSRHLVFRDAAIGQTGTFPLDEGVNVNYATCTHCVLVFVDMEESVGPSKVLFQAAGDLSIDPTFPPDVSSPNIWTWSGNAVLVEVTIDEVTNLSTPVPGGECYRDLGTVFLNGFEPFNAGW